MNSTEKSLISLAAGIAIGVGLGILFAPQKGVDTRRRIRKEFDRCRDRLEDAVGSIEEIIEEKITQRSKKVEDEQEA